MPRRCDIWRIGIVDASIADIAKAGTVAPFPMTWLPEEPSFRFLADPFGLWRNERLYVFAEAYDYRTRHGIIDCLTLEPDFRIIARETVLREPWHLSYPYVFEAEGETWMLPEASRSGELTLYRAERFPDRWACVARISLDVAAIDATPIHHQGRWWLFYTGGAIREDRMGALRVASAESLPGPWRVHPHSPVRRDMAGARPGGTPFVVDGVLTLPVQDCSQTYGGAIRLLRFTSLREDRIETELGPLIAPPDAFAPYARGLHTLAGCGPVTLIDAKRIDANGKGWLIELGRRIRALRGDF